MVASLYLDDLSSRSRHVDQVQLGGGHSEVKSAVVI